jgi:hypothetical protein
MKCVDHSWEKYCTEPYQIHGGRSMNFLVSDKGQTFGVILLRNDTVNLKPRDEYIGWESRARLPFILRATCFSPDPKLVPLLVRISSSREFLSFWNYEYRGQHIVGITTSSLQEDIPDWDYCGEYTSTTDVNPSPEISEKVIAWMREKHPTKDPNEVFNLWQIKLPKIETKKKIYFCKLYKDALQFLRGDEEVIQAVPAFNNSMMLLFEDWKKSI